MSKFCIKCGKQNKDRAKFCARCGEKFRGTPTVNIDTSVLLDNRYEIIAIVKSGGMGCIYKARDTRLDIIVAIKEMLSFSRTQEEAKRAEERFKEEARMLSKLHHGGLPKVSDFFIIQDPLTKKTCNYLAMTFIEGEDLETIIEDSVTAGKMPFAIPMVLSYLKHIAKILHYLHTQTPPIIYRDLKPSNIMIQDERIFLVDFGLARCFAPSRKATIAGTYGYIPPEQLNGNVSPQGDIYSLGALAHYLLTGRNPEDQESLIVEFEPVRNVNPSVPEELGELITSMLSIYYSRRPQSAEALLEKLSELTAAPRHHGKKEKEIHTVEIEALKEKGNTLHRKGLHQEALECFDRATELDPDDQKSWYLKGNTLYKLNKDEDAIKCYARAIKLQPDDYRPWYNMGNALARLTRHEKAMKCYERATALHADDYKPWYNKGILYNKLGRQAEAVQCYDKALELQQHDPGLWLNRGISLNRLGRCEEALACFDRAQELHHDDCKALFNRAISLNKLGRYEEAIESCDMALAINPDHAAAWGAKGISLCQLDRLNEALACFDRAIDINIEDADTWFERGVCYYRIGNKGQAKMNFKTASKLNPALEAKVREFTEYTMRKPGEN